MKAGRPAYKWTYEYLVYYRKDPEETLLASGSAKEVANYMGIKLQTFYKGQGEKRRFYGDGGKYKVIKIKYREE